MEPSASLQLLSALLFSVGLTVLITKRNTIMMLMGIELMLNASNLNLVSLYHGLPSASTSGSVLDGQIFALFVIIVAVCEAAVGMAIILRTYHHFHTSIPDQMTELKEKF